MKEKLKRSDPNYRAPTGDGKGLRAPRPRIRAAEPKSARFFDSLAMNVALEMSRAIQSEGLGKIGVAGEKSIQTATRGSASLWSLAKAFLSDGELTKGEARALIGRAQMEARRARRPQ